MSVAFNTSTLPRISFKELEELLYIDDSPISIDMDLRAQTTLYHNRVLSAYVQKLQSSYSAISSQYVPVSEDLETNMANASKFKSSLAYLNGLNLKSIDQGLNSIDSQLKRNETSCMEQFNKGLTELEQEKNNIRVAIEDRHQNEINSLETQKASLLSAYQDKLSGLYAQMEEIVAGFEDLEYLERVYQVEHTDIDLRVDQVDLKEFKKLIDLASYALRVVKAQNPISVIASVLYLPAVVRVGMQREFSCIYLVVLALLLAIFPQLLGCVAVLFFINLAVNVYQAYDNQRILQVAYLVMRDSAKIKRQINLLLNKQPAVMQLTMQRRELDFVDLDAEIVVAQKDVEERILAYKATSPEPRLKEIREHITKKDNMETLMYQAEYKASNHIHSLERLITKISQNYSAIMDWIKKYSENLSSYGCDIKDTAVLSATFRVAQRQYEGLTVGSFIHELPLRNFLFRYKDDTARAQLVNVMKLLYINMFNNVYAGSLITIITDPMNLGVDFNEWFDNSLERVLKLETDGFQKSFEKIKEIAQKNMFSCGAKTFTEYNRESEKQGRVALPYHLWIIMSSADELGEKKDFLPFLQISEERGVIIWVLQPTLLDDKGQVDTKRMLDLDVRFEEEGSYFHKGEKVTYQVPGEANMRYSLNLGLAAKQYYIDMMSKGRVVIVDYETAFRQKVIPDDKIWAYTTLKGIDLHYGFLNGDPSSPLVETLGDDAVHCLMGGQTGAGKSATINMVLANLLYMYPPEWLELVMIDFKRVEFIMYTGDLLIPHASIISGTKDGEYALSIFDWVLNEMARRQKLIGKYKFQKIQDWNQAVLDGKIDEPVIPRILMLFDEFQAMFVAVADDKLDLIKKRIMALSKEARAMGVHMWFTSQSMKGTMSDDILEQFKMRACLSVPTAETSNSILGNDAASTLVGKGWIYLNCNGGKSQYNHKYQIPYISNEGIKQYLPKLIRRIYDDKDEHGRPRPHIHRHAEFYDEEEMFGEDKLDSYYVKYVELRDDPFMFLLGERTAFSTNLLPEHLRLLNSDGEHICVHAYERADACNILSTILDNLQYKEDASILATFGDEDISALIGISSYMTEEGIALSRKSNADQLINILMGEVERREAAKETGPSMYYFLIGLDKLPDLESNYNLWEGVHPELLKRGAAVGIHLITYARDTRTLRKSLRYSTHVICAKTIETDSQTMLEKSVACKLSDGIAIYKVGTELSKFKIYLHTYDESKLQQRSTFIARKAE